VSPSTLLRTVSLSNGLSNGLSNHLEFAICYLEFSDTLILRNIPPFFQVKRFDSDLTKWIRVMRLIE
jgi:hypothetical protein